MISQDIAKFRELFLFDVNVQARLKATQTTDLFLEEAVKVSKDNGLNISVEELRQAIENYARTGEGGSPTCGPATVNEPPLDPPSVDNLIDLVRQTPNGICQW